MLERLDYVKLAPKQILDLGCSRGGSFDPLSSRYPEARIIGVDLSLPMLQAVEMAKPAWSRWFGLGKPRPDRLVGNALKLPLKSRSTAIVWSNLLLHWLDHPLPALAEAHRVLEVGGLLMFSTLGPDTLKELRTAFADGYAHTQRFTDMHDLGDMLIDSGFSDPVMDMEVITLTYDDMDALFAELRAAGSSCAMKARRHSLTGRGRLAAVRQAYEALRQDGKLPATFEVIYGHAWKPEARQTTDGRSVIRFDLPRKS